MSINIETLRSVRNERGTIISIIADGDSENPGVWKQSGNVWKEEEAKKWRAVGRRVIEGPAVFTDFDLQLRHPSAKQIGSFVLNTEFKRCWINVEEGRKQS